MHGMSLWFWALNAIIPQSEKLREFWVADQLKKLKKNTKLLDAGAGECYYRRYCNHLKYTSQDFGKYDGRGDGKGIQTKTRDSSNIDIISDIVDIPVASDYFGAVLCIEVFEHIPRPLDALREFSRVIKKNGMLILSAPRSSLTHYSPYYYYSGFSENFYRENFPLCGFKIEKMYVYGNYFDFLSLELIRVVLVCLRSRNILVIFLLPLYIFVIPVYILLRIFSFFLPKSSDLLSFGICIKAKKL